VTSLLRRMTGEPEQRFTFNDLLTQLNFNGLNYPLMTGGAPYGKTEDIESSFTGYVNGAYKSNGVVFACMLARMMLFSEARFQFRQMRYRPARGFVRDGGARGAGEAVAERYDGGSAREGDH
jgi:hypothetical protein